MVTTIIVQCTNIELGYEDTEAGCVQDRDNSNLAKLVMCYVMVANTIVQHMDNNSRATKIKGHFARQGQQQFNKVFFIYYNVVAIATHA